MAEGTALRFQRDEQGLPQVMFICDVLATCPICGREVIERFYDETDYHRLTAARFRQLVEDAPARMGRECEQCGEPLGAEQVSAWTLTYGFPTQKGLLQGRGSQATATRSHVYTLSPYRRFDVQMQPEFETEIDQSVVASDSLVEADVHRVLGRYLNAKAGWRRLLKRSLSENPPATIAERLGGGQYGLVGSDERLVRSAFEGLQQTRPDQPDSAWIVQALGDPIGELLPLGPHEWVPAGWYDALKTNQVVTWAVADLAELELHLRTALGALPADISVEVDDSFVVSITFPMGAKTAVERLSLAQLAAQAMMVGAAPADWVQLWLDETILELAARLDPDEPASADG